VLVSQRPAAAFFLSTLPPIYGFGIISPKPRKSLVIGISQPFLEMVLAASLVACDG